MSLVDVYHNIQTGDFARARQVIADLPPSDKIQGHAFEAMIENLLGYFDKAASIIGDNLLVAKREEDLVGEFTLLVSKAYNSIAHASLRVLKEDIGQISVLLDRHSALKEMLNYDFWYVWYKLMQGFMLTLQGKIGESRSLLDHLLDLVRGIRDDFLLCFLWSQIIQISANTGEKSRKELAIEEMNTAAERLDNPLLLALAHLHTGMSLAETEMSKALSHLHSCLQLALDHGNKLMELLAYYNMGAAHGYHANYKLLLEFTHKARTLAQKNGHRTLYVSLTNNLGVTYTNLGRYSEAIMMFQEGLKISDELEMKNTAIGAILYFNLAFEYQRKGELQLALQSFENSLEIAKSANITRSQAAALSNIGHMMYLLDDLENAEHKLLEALDIATPTGEEVLQVNILLNIVRFYADTGDLPRAERYLEHMQDITDAIENEAIELTCTYAKGLVFRRNRKLMYRGEAQRCFTELINHEKTQAYTKALAILYLCDLLIDELTISHDEQTIKEARELVSQLYELSQENHFFPLLVESLIIQSKFLVVEGDMDAAESRLIQGKLLAEERDLTNLRDKVDSEISNLQQKLESWNQILHKEQPLVERLQQSRLKKYLDDALKLANAADNQY